MAFVLPSSTTIAAAATFKSSSTLLSTTLRNRLYHRPHRNLQTVHHYRPRRHLRPYTPTMSSSAGSNAPPPEQQPEAPAVPADLTQPTIFDKIIAKDIPADVVYEDDETLAFRDINPQAPVHVLVIPKRRISMLSLAQQSDKELLGQLMLTASKVAQIEGLDTDGYRVLVNNGPNGLQSVYHLHLHVIGGRKLKWGPF